MFWDSFIVGFDATGYKHILAATADGGRTWTVRGLLPFIPNAVPNNLLKVDSCGEVAFVGPAHGWCMGQISTLDTHKDLYRTSDGGLTWTRDGRVPAVGGLYFVDTSTGFLSIGDPSGFMLYKTVDGGASWTRVVTTNGG